MSHIVKMCCWDICYCSYHALYRKQLKWVIWVPSTRWKRFSFQRQKNTSEFPRASEDLRLRYLSWFLWHPFRPASYLLHWPEKTRFWGGENKSNQRAKNPLNHEPLPQMATFLLTATAQLAWKNTLWLNKFQIVTELEQKTSHAVHINHGLTFIHSQSGCERQDEAVHVCVCYSLVRENKAQIRECLRFLLACPCLPQRKKLFRQVNK